VSVSRAGEVSLVAVTDAGPVGVDVEGVGAARFTGFADVALHPDEDVTTDPTRAWVRKEALLKACGLGLAVDPRHLGLDGTALVAWESPLEGPGTVWLRDVDVSGHIAAVAVLPRADIDLTGLTPVAREAR
jgi:4'-phosphopantetheinyl transferase